MKLRLRGSARIGRVALVLSVSVLALFTSRVNGTDESLGGAGPGSLTGVGVFLGDAENGVLLRNVIPGSPAEAAGLRAGDVIVSIDGISAARMAVADAANLLRGESGTSVRVGVAADSGGEPREVTLIRAAIRIPSPSSLGMPQPESRLGEGARERFQSESPQEAVSPRDILSGPLEISPMRSGGDGQYRTINIEGRPYFRTLKSQGSDYLYFDVSSACGFSAATGPLYVHVVYRDSGEGTLRLQYDSRSLVGGHELRVYRPADRAFGEALRNRSEDREAVFVLSEPLFAGRQNGGADFRLDGQMIDRPLTVHKVWLRTTPPLFLRLSEAGVSLFGRPPLHGGTDSRVLSFPDDRCLGTLMGHDRREPESLSWRSLGPARGGVTVPSGVAATLFVDPERADFLSPLDGLPADSLDGLSVESAAIDDNGLDRILRFKSLRALSLGKTRITDNGLSRLGRLPKLRVLRLDGCGITDGGLVPLLEMKNLVRLGLKDTRVTPSGLARLEIALPVCSVEHSLVPQSPSFGEHARNWSALLVDTVNHHSVRALYESLVARRVAPSRIVVLAELEPKWRPNWDGLHHVLSGPVSEEKIRAELRRMAQAARGDEAVLVAISTHMGPDRICIPGRHLRYHELNTELERFPRETLIVVILGGCESGGAIPVLTRPNILYTAASTGKCEGRMLFSDLSRALKETPTKADRDGNGYVTLGEAFDFADDEIRGTSEYWLERPARQIRPRGSCLDYCILFPVSDPGTSRGRLRPVSTEESVSGRAVSVDDLVRGDAVPDFTAATVDGRAVRLSDYRGTIVLLDFWATWCGPCKAEMANVLEAYRRYKNSGFEVIGVSLDTNESALKEYIEANGIPWPQVFDGRGWDNAVAKQFGVHGIPAPVLLDRDLRVYLPKARGEVLSQALDELLGSEKRRRDSETVRY
ncbi:redoxin domain-containing protein [Candidatus Sumerlaeota bacterium]|nr:redoxin domain-containing protein [Candidatus Sumerlaeota bacterium]